VDDIKEGPLDATTDPALYVPFNQEPHYTFCVVVRTSQEPRALLATLVGTAHQIDPGIMASGEETMVERITQSQSAYLHRSSAWVVGGFAAVALFLGMIGLYGVVAYSVSQRTREIGVRMALGAQRSSVYQLVLREAGRLTAFGLVAGLICAVAAATLMRKLLFSTQPWDVPTLATVATVLAVSALSASYIPARRAASVNPVEALRAD
jgi:macrolide transport system ATP-binding/permease protein